MANPAQNELWLELLAQIDTHGVEAIKMYTSEDWGNEPVYLSDVQFADNEVRVILDQE